MTYNEDRVWNKKNSDLGDDRIVLKINNLIGSRFELVFPLADLSPAYDRLLLREGSRILIISLLVVIVLLVLMWPLFYAGVYDMRILWGALGSLVVLFGILAALWPRTEYVLFKWKTGVAALAIGRRGSEKARFDSFVTALTEAIRARVDPNNAGATGP